MRLGLLAVALMVSIWPFACQEAPASAPVGSGSPPMICTTFYPNTYLASRVAGDAVRVVCPVPPEADPAHWAPTREDLVTFQRADLVIINGAGFESWIETAALPESRVVDSTRQFRAELLKYETVTHTHGPGGAHSHTGIDGHTWLDPVNAKAQAAEIVRALSARWPAHAKAFEQRFDALAEDLDGLDRRFVELAPKARTAVMLASHPAYNYLSRRYSLGVINLEMDPGILPDEAVLTGIGRAVGKAPDSAVRIMLWEQEPLVEGARLLRERFGIQSVHFSPCESLSPDDAKSGNDFLGLMTANVERLEGALRGVR